MPDDAQARREQRTATGVLESVFKVLHPRDAKPEQWASQLMADVRAHYWQSDEPLNKQSLSACAEVMRAMAEQWKDRNK